MDLQESQGMKGSLTIERTNSLGELVEKIFIPNLVVTTGKTFIASRIVGTASAVMSHMALGTGAVAPVVGDTTLGSEIGRVALASGTAAAAVATFTANFPAGTATGALTEAGIFNAASAGTMMCRTTFPVVNKAALDSISISWAVTVA